MAKKTSIGVGDFGQGAVRSHAAIDCCLPNLPLVTATRADIGVGGVGEAEDGKGIVFHVSSVGKLGRGTRVCMRYVVSQSKRLRRNKEPNKRVHRSPVLIWAEAEQKRAAKATTAQNAMYEPTCRRRSVRVP